MIYFALALFAFLAKGDEDEMEKCIEESCMKVVQKCAKGLDMESERDQMNFEACFFEGMTDDDECNSCLKEVDEMCLFFDCEKEIDSCLKNDQTVGDMEKMSEEDMSKFGECLFGGAVKNKECMGCLMSTIEDDDSSDDWDPEDKDQDEPYDFEHIEECGMKVIELIEPMLECLLESENGKQKCLDNENGCTWGKFFDYCDMKEETICHYVPKDTCKIKTKCERGKFKGRYVEECVGEKCYGEHGKYKGDSDDSDDSSDSESEEDWEWECDTKCDKVAEKHKCWEKRGEMQDIKCILENSKENSECYKCLEEDFHHSVSEDHCEGNGKPFKVGMKLDCEGSPITTVGLCSGKKCQKVTWEDEDEDVWFTMDCEAGMMVVKSFTDDECSFLEEDGEDELENGICVTEESDEGKFKMSYTWPSWVCEDNNDDSSDDSSSDSDEFQECMQKCESVAEKHRCWERQGEMQDIKCLVENAKEDSDCYKCLADEFHTKILKEGHCDDNGEVFKVGMQLDCKDDPLTTIELCTGKKCQPAHWEEDDDDATWFTINCIGEDEMDINIYGNEYCSGEPLEVENIMNGVCIDEDDGEGNTFKMNYIWEANVCGGGGGDKPTQTACKKIKDKDTCKDRMDCESKGKKCRDLKCNKIKDGDVCILREDCEAIMKKKEFKKCAKGK